MCLSPPGTASAFLTTSVKRSGPPLGRTLTVRMAGRKDRGERGNVRPAPVKSNRAVGASRGDMAFLADAVRTAAEPKVDFPGPPTRSDIVARKDCGPARSTE